MVVVPVLSASGMVRYGYSYWLAVACLVILVFKMLYYRMVFRMDTGVVVPM